MKILKLRFELTKCEQRIFHFKSRVQRIFCNQFWQKFSTEFFVFIADKGSINHAIPWKPYKFKQVRRFVLESEAMAFPDSFDISFMPKHAHKHIFSFILLIMLTDHHNLTLNLGVVLWPKKFNDQLANAERMLYGAHVSLVGLRYDVADSFNKDKASSVWMKALKTGKFHHQNEQCMD